MKNFLIVLLVVFISFHAKAQDIFTDENTQFQKADGTNISATLAKEILYGSVQKYELKKSEGENGKTIVRLIPISEKQFWKNIDADQKKVKKLKGTEMVAFSLQDKDEAVVTNESLKGKLTVYNFWFTGCRPCLVEIPQLNELVDKYGEEVNFIAPTFEEREKMIKFINRKTFKYNTLSGADKLAQELSVTSYPTHFVVDKDGVIKNVFIGGSETIGKTLDKAIKSNLK